MDVFFLQLLLLCLIAFIIFSLFKLGISKMNLDKKLIWCILILAFPVSGSLAYFIVGNK